MLSGLPRWLGWVRDPEHVRRVTVLARAPVFAGLPRRLLGRLASRLFEKAYGAGEFVFREGDPARGLFIVVDGEVEVFREGGERLALFGPGTSFGEMGLLDDLPRSASARATGPVHLLILYRTHFDGLVEGDRSIALVVLHNLLRMLAGYVRSMSAAAGAARPAGASPPAAGGPAPASPPEPTR